MAYEMYRIRNVAYPGQEADLIDGNPVGPVQGHSINDGSTNMLWRLTVVNNTPPKPLEVVLNNVRTKLPANAFDAAHFSPFIQAYAMRDPNKASLIMKDMVDLGIKPQIVQWSIVARGYAQHGNPLTALQILDWLEDSERKRSMDNKQGMEERLYCPSDTLLGTCTNVLRGFVMAGDIGSAREVERRIVERFGYGFGERRATDAAIASLRRLEGKLAQCTTK